MWKRSHNRGRKKGVVETVRRKINNKGRELKSIYREKIKDLKDDRLKKWVSKCSRGELYSQKDIEHLEYKQQHNF